MAIIKIMGLISLPDPGHICGRREKRKGNGMERDENATGKRIVSRLSPCHALQRKQTEQEDLPSFLLRFPPSLLHKCLIIFFPFGATLGTLNRSAATEHFFIIY